LSRRIGTRESIHRVEIRAQSARGDLRRRDDRRGQRLAAELVGEPAAARAVSRLATSSSGRAWSSRLRFELRRERQANAKVRAGNTPSKDLHRASVGLHEFRDDRQADARCL
jgi:hypothetical protein